MEFYCGLTGMLRPDWGRLGVLCNFPCPSSGDVPAACDLHTAVTNVCGVGYRACNITQCGGPHFSHSGFQMLGETLAQCVMKAVRV